MAGKRNIKENYEPPFDAAGYKPGNPKMKRIGTGSGLTGGDSKQMKGDSEGTTQINAKHKDNELKSSHGEATDNIQAKVGHDWPDQPNNDGASGEFITGYDYTGSAPEPTVESWDIDNIGQLIGEDVNIQDLFNEYAKNRRSVNSAEFKAVCHANGLNYPMNEDMFRKLLDNNRDYVFTEHHDGFHRFYIAENFGMGAMPAQTSGQPVEHQKPEGSCGAMGACGMGNDEAKANELYNKAVNQRTRLSPEEEEVIISDPMTAYKYAFALIKGRWHEAEESINSDPEAKELYQKNILQVEGSGEGLGGHVPAEESDAEGWGNDTTFDEVKHLFKHGGEGEGWCGASANGWGEHEEMGAESKGWGQTAKENEEHAMGMGNDEECPCITGGKCTGKCGGSCGTSAKDESHGSAWGASMESKLTKFFNDARGIIKENSKYGRRIVGLKLNESWDMTAGYCRLGNNKKVINALTILKGKYPSFNPLFENSQKVIKTGFMDSKGEGPTTEEGEGTPGMDEFTEVASKGLNNREPKNNIDKKFTPYEKE